MEVIFSASALDDLAYWKQKNEQKVLKKIRTLIEAIGLSPFEGIGKPEPLKHNLAGMWSRRINSKHRIVYEISGQSVIIHALKEHY